MERTNQSVRRTLERFSERLEEMIFKYRDKKYVERCLNIAISELQEIISNIDNGTYENIIYVHQETLERQVERCDAARRVYVGGFVQVTLIENSLYPDLYLVTTERISDYIARSA